MAGKKQSKGNCAYCEKELSKGGMSKHLASCKARQTAIEKAAAKKAASETLYHLRVQDAYRPEFWLNLEMRGSRKLKDLDNYLRVIWLECCGHLSEFSLGGFQNTVGMSRTIDQVFSDADAILHTYDFGTSSETLIKRISAREGKPLSRKAIALMARNNPPADTCITCGQPATHLCTECLYEDETWGTLCGKHAETHPHHSYGEPIELVNSPRLGMCGYEGPAEPPY
ncbi:hypothetical protein [cf. Phormidesmis sp. LEGE 11477]|uniref:hypothetical protein n=1 Tax=cf. Phormidesmis sp. LEGE 11477 TaxID=1828680 RepID=UPI001882DAFD|nr:hypothetical protein [cf. Phormidesmis sp. LEGE 11477]MBE9062499.1 hypothetical protein [cf. Phormidesmis sp. LEGE 11477]